MNGSLIDAVNFGQVFNWKRGGGGEGGGQKDLNWLARCVGLTIAQELPLFADETKVVNDVRVDGDVVLLVVEL